MQTAANHHSRLARPGSIMFALVAATALAACGYATSGASPTPTAAPATPTSAASSAATTYTIAVAQAPAGAYLTGEDGKALYVLTKDSANTSTCTGGCAQNWPPFTLDPGEQAVAGTGVTGAIGTFTRADGSKQVTVGGMPVYYFGGDSAAGQTNGQGINDVWFLASPAGAPVGGSSASQVPTQAPTQAAPSMAPTSSPSGTAGTGSTYTIQVVQGPFGAFLAGKDGKSLYVNTNDSANTTTCTGGCASNWPPFTLNPGETAVAGSGVTGAVGTFSRPDGSKQVTVGGMPVYYFGGDSAAGQTNGQGINNVWYLASPAGTPASSTSPGSGSPYGSSSYPYSKSY